MWLFGGVGVGGDLFGDLWVLRGGCRWEEIEFQNGSNLPRPLPVSDHEMARWGRDLLLVGGKTAIADDAGQPLWKFDTVECKWEVRVDEHHVYIECIVATVHLII